MKQRYGILLLILLFTLLPVACTSPPEMATPTTAVTPTHELGTAVVTTPSAVTTTPPQADSENIALDMGATVSARTPVPTPTLSAVDQKINQVADNIGIADSTILGLTPTDWFNIFISVLIVLLGYVVGGKLLMVVLRWFVQRTSITLDDQLLSQIGQDLQWFVVVIFARYAVMRLDFITDGFRTFLDDVFFLLLLGIGTAIALRLIDFSTKRYMQSLSDENDRNRLDAVMTAAKRVGDFFVLIIAISIAMDHFGISVNALSVALLVFGVMIALGSKGVISDFLSGFIILVDQPFRVGDVIRIQSLDTTGQVVSIGTRTTHVVTYDNRKVIVPNSQIGENQVVNYSFPDPEYRLQTDLDVAYGSDLDVVEQIITDAVRRVEKVLPDKPVDVLFLEFGDSGEKIRVRWWIGSYDDEFEMLNKVNVAIANALDKAGIVIPFTTIDLNLKQTEGSRPNDQE